MSNVLNSRLGRKILVFHGYGQAIISGHRINFQDTTWSKPNTVGQHAIGIRIRSDTESYKCFGLKILDGGQPNLQRGVFPIGVVRAPSIAVEKLGQA